MTTVHRYCEAPATEVWAVLADPWLYASWVVGASRIRDAEGDWPEPGARIHHSVGAWPALLNDHTEVVECTRGRELTLRAKGRPLGQALVRMRLDDRGSGCDITMYETAESGPGAMVPDAVLSPLIRWRNTEALRRLALIAEGRARRRQDGTSG